MSILNRDIVSARACEEEHTLEEIGRALEITGDAVSGRYRRWKDEYTPWACPVCYDGPRVEGGIDLVDSALDPTEIWEWAKRKQRHRDQQEARRSSQRIIVPGNAPFGIAYLADLHLGGATDYAAIHHDAKLVRDTPRLYAGFLGDGVDNWIHAKLMGLQRQQEIAFDEEWCLFRDFLGILGNKLLFLVSGNHELWSFALAGIDRAKSMLSSLVLYNKHEVVFDLVLDTASWTVKARHKWRGSSVFNETHGVEVGWERGDTDFDVGIGAHDHRGTLCRPFYRHGIQRFAIKIGTYKQDDYGVQLGLPRTHGSGCGATIHWPDRRMTFIQDLDTAAEFLQFLNKA